MIISLEEVLFIYVVGGLSICLILYMCKKCEEDIYHPT